jgi:hypothetical protein
LISLKLLYYILDNKHFNKFLEETLGKEPAEIAKLLENDTVCIIIVLIILPTDISIYPYQTGAVSHNYVDFCCNLKTEKDNAKIYWPLNTDLV